MAKKHHVKQSLQQVEIIRARVLRMMARDLMSLRSFISGIPGNEAAVERLRGKSGEEILERVADTVMCEIGDNACLSKPAASGVSRYLAGKGKAMLGTDDLEEASGEAQTA
jgi:hypothetical protein